MSKDCEVKLDSQVIANDNYDLLVKTNSGQTIEVSNAVISDSKVTSVINIEGDIYVEGEFVVINKILFIPGIGYLTPGTRVIYKNKDYCLCYGWHTNISNQTMISWYLESLEENIPDKTLYKEMINEIELVHFR